MTLPGNSHSLVAACTPHLEARDLVAPCCKCHATYICLSYEGCVHIDTSVKPRQGWYRTRRHEGSSGGRLLENLRSNTRFAVSSQAMTGVSSAILLRPWQLIKVSFTMLAGVWHCEVWISHVSCLLNMPRRCKTQLNKTRLDRAHHQARSEQRQAGCIAPCTSSADACSQWPAAKPGRDYRHSRWQRGSRDQAPDTFQNGTAVLPPLKGLRKPH